MRSLCGQLKEAEAPEAGTISDISKGITTRLDGMEDLLIRGDMEDIQLRALAKEAEESASRLNTTADSSSRRLNGSTSHDNRRFAPLSHPPIALIAAQPTAGLDP